MKDFMNYFTLILCVTFSLFGVACQTPNQPNAVPLSKVQAQLPQQPPGYWIALSPSDPKMAYLDSPTRQSLVAFRKSLEAERSTFAFGFHGKYSDATYTEMKEINDACNKSYCANAVVIGRDQTPELAGTSLSINEAYMNSATVGDVDLRQVQDDWARLWLMNKPSTLSPYPIVNTGGRP